MNPFKYIHDKFFNFDRLANISSDPLRIVIAVLVCECFDLPILAGVLSSLVLGAGIYYLIPKFRATSKGLLIPIPYAIIYTFTTTSK